METWVSQNITDTSSKQYKQHDYFILFYCSKPTVYYVSLSRGSSHLRDRIQVSCLAGKFFTIWANREALVYIYIYININIYRLNIYIMMLFIFILCYLCLCYNIVSYTMIQTWWFSPNISQDRLSKLRERYNTQVYQLAFTLYIKVCMYKNSC